MKLRATVKNIIPKKYRPGLLKIYQYLKQDLKLLKYFGNRFICPCCNGRFRKFLTYGVKLRPNACCPRCGSLERHRLLWLYFKNNTNIFSENLRVLHFAPKHIFQKMFMSLPNLDYVSADLNSSKTKVKMDITNILFEDNWFDVIICIHVLEHVMDDKKAIRELYRVLKPAGWAILQVPIDFNHDKTFEDSSIVLPEKRERTFGQKDHVRVYGQDYIERLKEAGFIVRQINYTSELKDSIVRRCSLNREPICLCTKPAP